MTIFGIICELRQGDEMTSSPVFLFIAVSLVVLAGSPVKAQQGAPPPAVLVQPAELRSMTKQAEFVGRLIHQRKQYPERFRQVLARHLTLRHLADYAPEMVTYLHASRAVHRAQDFLAVIRAEVTPHAH